MKDFATSSFKVADLSKITRTLAKLCYPSRNEWSTKKHCDRYDGVAPGMDDFIVFYWRVKKVVSFGGKGAGKAKKWVLNELDKVSEYCGTNDNLGVSCEMEIEEIDMIDDKELSILRDGTIPYGHGTDIEMIDSKSHAKVNTPRNLTKGLGPRKKKVIRPVASRRSGSCTLSSSPTTTMVLDAGKNGSVPEVFKQAEWDSSCDHIKTALRVSCNSKKSGVCFSWLKGKCKWESACRFKHNERRYSGTSAGATSDFHDDRNDNGFVDEEYGRIDRYPSSSRMSENITAVCLELLMVIRNDPNAKAFLKPVDWRALGLPSYLQIIRIPMDLHTVETKLGKGSYDTALEFYHDVKLIWRNSMTYNQDGSEYYVAAKKLSNL